MVSTRGLRVALSIAVLSITGLSSGLVGVAVASAAAGPKLVVTPAKNLRNGEVVHVTGSGFKAGDNLYLVECLAKAKGEGGCDVGSAKPLTASASGSLPKTTFKVEEGKIGTSKCGTTKTNLKNCALSIGTMTGGDSAVALIAFKAPLKK